MESLLDKFTSSTYKVLKQIYDCQMKLPDGTSYIPISQAELARIIGVSTITMNKYFKQFQEDGIIKSYGETKGKYREKINKYIESWNIKNEDGTPYRYKSHEFRHTIATLTYLIVLYHVLSIKCFISTRY